jgi:hypothetical protein
MPLSYGDYRCDISASPIRTSRHCGAARLCSQSHVTRDRHPQAGDLLRSPPRRWPPTGHNLFRNERYVGEAGASSERRGNRIVITSVVRLKREDAAGRPGSKWRTWTFTVSTDSPGPACPQPTSSDPIPATANPIVFYQDPPVAERGQPMTITGNSGPAGNPIIHVSRKVVGRAPI